MHSVPGCVFHCYACPLASFACPIGVIASFSALHVFPFLAVGALVLVGGLVGSLVCGWACPFGLLQDLAAKLPTRKFRIPNWMGHARFLVLIGLVVLVPYFWGKKDNPLFPCSLCPAGAIEASMPNTISQAWAGEPVTLMSGYKLAILAVILSAMMFTYRPWCKVLCPLGGILALFNRVSVFHLRFAPEKCTECNRCRSQCAIGVKVEQEANTVGCIRCLECTTCGAIEPAIAAPGVRKPRKDT